MIHNAESNRDTGGRYLPVNKLAVNKLGNLWCSLMHNSPSWPIHDHYTCHICGRQHLVDWAL